MNSFWIILFHTYINKLKTKSFIITTLLTVLIVLALTNLTHIIAIFDKNGGIENVAVLDDTGQLYEPFQKQVSTINKDIKLTLFTGSEKEAEKAVENGSYQGMIQIGLNSEKLPIATYKARSVADSSLFTDLQTSLQQ
jgi:ABC-2 type transport system permease protein